MNACRLVVICASAVAVSCATTGKVPGRVDVGEAIEARAGRGIRPAGDRATMPPDVSIDDGLTVDEAVAIALWNSPSFEASLADLGLARADVVEAGLLRNPILSLLFPWGPKQLEWTAQFPLDVLWQRPKRIAAATAHAEAVAQRLVGEAVALIADVRDDYLDAVAARLRVRSTEDSASVARRIGSIAEVRLNAGDISELESRAARSDVVLVEAHLRSVRHEEELARVRLAARLGLDIAPDRVTLAQMDAFSAPVCGDPDAVIKEALAARPDVRAAELTVEAAGKRAAWERSRVLNLIAMLDANSQGKEGYEIGPGVGGELPLFARNQGNISRAQAELERASRRYLAIRTRVSAEVRTALIRVRQAQEAVDIWGREIVPSLEIEQRQAEAAYKVGEVPLLPVLDVNRRLVQARMRQIEVNVDLHRAGIALERAVGARCGAK